MATTIYETETCEGDMQESGYFNDIVGERASLSPDDENVVCRFQCDIDRNRSRYYLSLS